MKIVAITPSGDHLRVRLTDGEDLLVPRAPFPRLRHATQEELADYELTFDGEGAHWPQLDEDISIRGFLRYAEKQMEPES